MTWRLNVDLLESCSCAAVCPCVLGPAKPDQGWCSGAFGIHINDGESDGVDLSGVNVAVLFDLTGDFISGIDVAKLYVDSGASDAQRRELDAIFHGEKGGLWAGMREAIKEWQPTAVARVEISDGDMPRARVEGIGEIVLAPIRLEDGTPTTISGAPVLAAFGLAKANLGFANGTKFADPDMRAWESLGAGSKSQVEWAA